MKHNVQGKRCVFHGVRCTLFLVAIDMKPLASHQGWGESVVPGLRGTAWKQKVASIECIGQGATSGKSGPYLDALKYAHTGYACSGGMISVSSQTPLFSWYGFSYPVLTSSTAKHSQSLLSYNADPSQYLGPVILVLATHTKQFKDSNFNVLKAAFSAVKTLLDTGITGGDIRASCAAMAVVLAPAVDKLGDRKLQVHRFLISMLLGDNGGCHPVLNDRFGICSSTVLQPPILSCAFLTLRFTIQPPPTWSYCKLEDLAHRPRFACTLSYL